MSQNELQRVVAEMRAYVDCGDTADIDRLRTWASRIESAQAVAPGGGAYREYYEAHRALLKATKHREKVNSAFISGFRPGQDEANALLKAPSDAGWAAEKLAEERFSSAVKALAAAPASEASVGDGAPIPDSVVLAMGALNIALESQKGTRITLHRTRAKQILAALTTPASITTPYGKEFFMIPAGLHPHTVNLVARFASALADKLAKAEQKYGYSDGWASNDWMDECRSKLLEHVAKGDPRDVAAYCAFLWHHGASTAAASSAAEEDDYRVCNYCGCNTNAKLRRCCNLGYLEDKAASSAVGVPSLPGNWPEDASHENGDYECTCCHCGQTFYGHKRRVTCKRCANGTSDGLAASSAVGESVADPREGYTAALREGQSDGYEQEQAGELLPTLLGTTPTNLCNHQFTGDDLNTIVQDWSPHKMSEATAIGLARNLIAARAALLRRAARVEVDEAMGERALVVRALREDQAQWPDAYIEDEQRMERENMRSELCAALKVDGPSAYCRACQSVGMSNCAHFDECSGATCITCHRPLNLESGK